MCTTVVLFPLDFTQEQRQELCVCCTVYKITVEYGISPIVYHNPMSPNDITDFSKISLCTLQMFFAQSLSAYQFITVHSSIQYIYITCASPNAGTFILNLVSSLLTSHLFITGEGSGFNRGWMWAPGLPVYCTVRFHLCV